jgi:hypothetical protein
MRLLLSSDKWARQARQQGAFAACRARDGQPSGRLF